ncbi:MAG: carboxymuconolactone decarboxylase family protein [Gemmatimonadota bacterium]
MTDFTIHTLDSAPSGAREMLEATTTRFGFLPNLMGVMAEAPATLKAYLALGEAFAESSLTPVEQQLVLLTVSRHNGCAYCMAAHSAGAAMAGMHESDVRALRAGAMLEDPRLEALRRFTLAVLEKRGWVSPEDRDEFLAHGYTRQHILEVLTGIAMKTLSNYVNHIAGTPLDEAFSAVAWSPEEEGGGAAATPNPTGA